MIVGERTDPDRRTFPPRPSSVGEARRMVRDHLRSTGREDLVETAELLVSEIVTNALVHAGTPIEVVFRFVGSGLRVEVSDGSRHAPAPRGYGPSAGTGRGLTLLEQMADDWGVRPEADGKTVWFQIPTDIDAAGATDERPAPEVAPAGHGRDRGMPADTASGVVLVELLDVPLLLHEAWRQHAESLLREYLLAGLDAIDLSDASGPIEAHAGSSDAISLLAEQIPTSGVGEDPADVMVNAVEPRVSASRVTLSVPQASLPSFVTLGETLEAAIASVERGGYLNPVTQPELQELRSWICSEVRRQSEGELPAAWAPPVDVAPSAAAPSRWDAARVRQSRSAALAADDTDRIVAASRPALDLLGFAEESDLVGARLVNVIPERYRQAHLAGFTLHFLSGRAPLIGETVTVPVLRADGGETMVELTISTERSPEGRSVFVADLAPLQES